MNVDQTFYHEQQHITTMHRQTTMAVRVQGTKQSFTDVDGADK